MYLYLLLASTVLATGLFLIALKWPRAAQWLFFLLFVWASYTNFFTSQRTPEVYLEYADLTWSEWYRTFINGWFKTHIKLVVGCVVVYQALIALSMLAKGRIFRTGAWGAILFFLAIAPLGVGSGFPSTVIAAGAMVILLRPRQKG